MYLPAGDNVASGTKWRADVARGTTARVQRGAEATSHSCGWPTRGAGGAQGPGHVAGGHACPRGVRRAGIWRAHGIVGLGKKFGAVTQMRYRAPTFKRENFGHFFRVGLRSHTVLTLCR